EEERNALYQDLNKSLRAKKWDEAEAAVDKIEKLLPEDERGGMGMTRFRILLGRQDYKAAYALAGKLSEAYPDNPMLQNQLAWEIATKPGLEERDLDLAEKAAYRANDAAKGKDPAILDTVARVLFLKGEKDKAIEYQTKAVEFAEGQMKEQLQQTLASY